jgi:hypothetical protein
MNFRKPDTIFVAVSRVDGGVTLLRVVTQEYAPDPNDSTKKVIIATYDPTPAYIDSLIAKYVASGQWAGGRAPTSWRMVPDTYVEESTDRTFRNAWKDAPGRATPDTDMPKARELHRERLRDLRANILDALDADYMQADEVNDQAKKRSIATRKQALRDITNHPEIDAATTPEELKVAGIAVLNG